MKNIAVYARWLKWFSLIFVTPFIFYEFILTWCMDKVNIPTNQEGWMWFLGYLDGCTVAWQNGLMDLPLWQRVLGIGVDGVSYMLLCWGLVLFVKLLNQYQQGHIFAFRSFQLIRKMSRIAFIWALYAPIKSMLLSLIVTLHKGPGNRMITLSISSSDVYHIFFVGLLLIIVSIIYEGYKLKIDQDLTV